MMWSSSELNLTAIQHNILLMYCRSHYTVLPSFCSNGIGRSGAFICMHSQMERMKAEAMVDIFQFIKAVRIQRAGLVTTQVTVY